MEPAVSSATKTLPLKDLFSDFLYAFLEHTKSGDTLSSNTWVRELRDRTIGILGELAESYGFELRPMGGVGTIRRNNQYINFRKPPLKTNRGFYAIIGFNFEKEFVEYALGYSDDHDIPFGFIDTLFDVGREALSDFTERTARGLPSKRFKLSDTTDVELTQNLIKLLNAYNQCVDELSDDIKELMGERLNSVPHPAFALPFSNLFADRGEANAAFDLFKETLERLNIRDPHSDRLALTLPNKGLQMSLSYGARLLLHFRREGGILRISFCANQADLSAGEVFEGGEFNSNKEGVGIGIQSRAFSEFRRSAALKERYLRAVDALLRSYNQRTPFSRWHIPQLVEASLDIAARESLFTKGLSNFVTETARDEEPATISKEIQVAKGKNVIYFGPPGTGKTWTLLNKERERFVVAAQSTTREEQLQALVAEEPWWVVVGAALYKMGPSKVPDLVEHPLIKARHSVAAVKRVSNTIWANLQSHTPPDSQTVAYGNRQEPFIFQKAQDSTWSVIPDLLSGDAQVVLDLVHAVDKGAPSDGTISRYETVTFHQSFSYEDFIEGIKPRVGIDGASSIGYDIQPGVFKRLCDRARADREHGYAIFIDEINRGNVASIFGELISLIEEDKREGALQALSVRLPYSKELFSVPANVSIIGTMNSADRSVEALDSALRRRFSFIELAPSVAVLRDARIDIEGVDVARLFEVINQRLEKLLNRDHQIGHAYFLDLANGNGSLEALCALFQSKIIPLLQEYFYSDLGRIGLVLGSAFVERVESSEFARFEYPDADLLRERDIYGLKDPSRLTAQDFRSIYGE